MSCQLQEKARGGPWHNENFETPQESFPVSFCTIVEHSFIVTGEAWGVWSYRTSVHVCSLCCKGLWQGLRVCNITTLSLFSRFPFQRPTTHQMLHWMPRQGAVHSHSDRVSALILTRHRGVAKCSSRSSGSKNHFKITDKIRFRKPSGPGDLPTSAVHSALPDLWSPPPSFITKLTVQARRARALEPPPHGALLPVCCRFPTRSFRRKQSKEEHLDWQIHRISEFIIQVFLSVMLDNCNAVFLRFLPL